MEQATDDILVKIKKLLSLSKKNSNENEAAAAAAKAQEMLIRYNLSEEALDSVRTDKEERYTKEYYSGHRKGINEVRWKVMLAFAVAKGNLCKVIHIGARRELCWLGKPSNIAVAKYLYETLIWDLERISEEKWKQILILRKYQMENPELKLFTDNSLLFAHGRNWKKSFYIGAVETIRARLEEGLETLRVEEQINALIVVSDKELSRFFKQEFPNTISYKANSGQLNYSGYAAGREAGKTIQFKRGINGAGGSIGPNLLKKG